MEETLDIVSKESMELLIEIVCGFAVLGMLSFSMFASYIVPIIERLF